MAFVEGLEPDGQRVSVLHLETGAVTPLGPGRADGAPAWSADGRYLAFTSMTAEGRAVFISDNLGTPEALTHARYPAADIAWQRSENKLAYVLGATPDERQLYVYDPAARKETAWGGPARAFYRPVWLEGNSLMLFMAAAQALGLGVAVDQELQDRGFVREMGVLEEAAGKGAILSAGLRLKNEALTTDLYVVTETAAIPMPPEILAPDGEYQEYAPAAHPQADDIVYESNDGGDREIFTISFRRGISDISNHRAADWNPTWSPDGQWILFESFRSGQRGLWRVFPESIRVEEVAADETHQYFDGDFSPDGARVVMVSPRGEGPSLFTVPFRGGAIEPLAGAPADAFAPAWRPSPNGADE